MKNFFKSLRFCLLLVLTGAMIVSAYRLTEINQNLEQVTFYGKRTSFRATEIKEEIANLSSKVSKCNESTVQLNEKVSLIGDKAVSLEKRVASEATKLSSEFFTLNRGVAKLNEQASSIADKVASIEKRAETYAQEEPLPPPQLLPPLPESLLDDIQRFQAEKAKQEGKNHTDPPESDPWGDLFESIPDEPPTPPKKENVPKVAEYDRLVI